MSSVFRKDSVACEGEAIVDELISGAVSTGGPGITATPEGNTV